MSHFERRSGGEIVFAVACEALSAYIRGRNFADPWSEDDEEVAQI
ncbi:MAG: hypothetical protein ACP5DX_11450 [Paracoccaceae bacterium]|jgi:hypothetical protein